MIVRSHNDAILSQANALFQEHFVVLAMMLCADVSYMLAFPVSTIICFCLHVSVRLCPGSGNLSF